jgi:hypothetical protein
MTDEVTPKPAPKRRKHMRRFGAWSISLLLGTLTVVLFGVLALTGQPISVPDWVRTKVENKLEDNLNGIDIAFGDMVAIVEPGGRPGIVLRDVQITDPTGRPLAAMANMQASMALRPLLRGEIQPKRISMSGAIAQVRRDAQGQISLAFNGATPEAQGTTLPLMISQVDNLLLQPSLAALTQIDLRGLSLRYEDARVNKAWTIDGGRVVMNREDENLRVTADLALLGGGSGVATVSLNYSSELGSLESEFGALLTDVPASDIATQGAAFAWLDVIQAPISGAVRSGTTDEGKLSPLNATLNIGAGVVQPNPQSKPIPFDQVRSYFTYTAADEVLRFSEFYVDSKWVRTRLEGTAHLGGIRNNMQLNDLTAQFKLAELTTNPAELYPEPITLDGARMEFQMSFDPFRIKLGQAQIEDRGQIMLLSGDIIAGPDGWQTAIDGQMDAITPDRLLELWPARLVPKTRDWLVANLKAGDLSNLDLAVRLSPDHTPVTHVAFAYDNATVRFMNSMPPITGAQGQASLLDNRFVLAADKGVVTPDEGGPVDVSGSAFIIPDVTVKDGAPAVVRLSLDGTVTSLLSLLDRPPLKVLSNAGLPVALAAGNATVDGTLSLPLAKGVQASDVIYTATGVLSDVRSEVLVKDRLITADRQDLTLDNTEISISGNATFDGLPLNAKWSQPIGQENAGSNVKGTVELSPRALSVFNVGLPNGFVRGNGTANFDITFGDNTPRLTLSSNLRGVGLNIAPLGWSKSPGTSGNFSLSGQLGDRPGFPTFQLSAPGLSTSGSITLNEGGGLSRARFDQVRVGDWLNAKADLIGRGAGRSPAVQVTSGTLDLRRATFGSGGSGTRSGDTGPISLLLDRLQISDTIALRNFQGQFSTNGGLDGTFAGLVNGQASVTGRVLPQNGRSAIRIQAKDAGSVFAATGLLKQARGGQLSLTLVPVAEAGSFDGALIVENTRVQDAPAMAALLNAASIIGLLDELGGQGIQFSDVEAKFRLTPSLITLVSASAIGPSMGISMDGRYAVQSGQIDMRGVISPLYLLNGIGSILSRKGEGLIGFNYRLSGTAKAPLVSVNPLSALTPGILRDVFRPPTATVPQTGQNTQTPEQPPRRSSVPVEAGAGNR